MTPTLLAFLDDVEHGRIPADEVRHRARLARHEVERLSLPERVAEAVMGEREALSRNLKAIEGDYRILQGHYIGAGLKEAAELAGNVAGHFGKLSEAIRSRPALAQTLAGSPVPEPVVDAVNRVLRERGILLTADAVDAVSLAATIAAFTHWQLREPDVDPEPTPPADERDRLRVVEAAPTAPRPWRVSVDLHGYVHVLDAKSTPVVRIFNGRDFDNATAIAKLIVDSVNAPAPGAPDHG